MHHYLLVANRTLGGPELLEVIRDRMERGPAAFWVLAPTAPVTHLINDFNALSCAFPVDPEVLADADLGVSGAQSRLDTELGRIRALGATADGEVGGPDPLKAIAKALAEREVDEILLFTLPAGISRWLSLDLPHRLRRCTTVPVTVIASSADASRRS